MATDTTKSCCAYETCATCRYWHERITMRINGDEHRFPGEATGHPIARVNGIHYTVKPYDQRSPRHYLGFGGHLFTFRFHDGRELTSNDVMSQGEIPARFRDRLPDNAVIVPQPPVPTKVPFGPDEGKA